MAGFGAQGRNGPVFGSNKLSGRGAAPATRKLAFGAGGNNKGDGTQDKAKGFSGTGEGVAKSASFGRGGRGGRSAGNPLGSVRRGSSVFGGGRRGGKSAAFETGGGKNKASTFGTFSSTGHSKATPSSESGNGSGFIDQNTTQSGSRPSFSSGFARGGRQGRGRQGRGRQGRGRGRSASGRRPRSTGSQNVSSDTICAVSAQIQPRRLKSVSSFPF